MSEAEPAGDQEPGTSRPVFVSYATMDRKQALAVCQAIEKRGALFILQLAGLAWLILSPARPLAEKTAAAAAN